MIIRCPQCEHTRSINESKIPPTAELATCPRCKHRFRFRTLRRTAEPTPEPQCKRPAQSRHVGPPPGQTVLRPQSAVRESAEQADIWDAVDALYERWQAQLDQHVTEVEQPSRSPERQTAADPVVVQQAPQAVPSPTPTTENQGTPSRVKKARDLAPASPQTEHGANGQDRSPPAGDAPLAGLPDNPDQEGAAAPAAPVPGLPDSPHGPLHDHAPSPMDEPGPQDGRSGGGRSIPVAFPYANGGAKLEERVEHDLQILRQGPPSHPLRDLDKLKEFPDTDQNAHAADAHNRDIPWENPAEYGWVRGFMRTIRAVMFNAPVLFSGIRPEGSLAPGYLFFFTLGYLSTIATMAWGHATALLLPRVVSFPSSPHALPLLLLLAPVALGLMLLFVTGFIKITVSLFAPEKAVFPVIYRIVSYSAAPFILNIVPFVGPILGGLWFLVALILGCRHGLGLSWGLACTVPLLPTAALLGGLVWYCV